MIQSMRLGVSFDGGDPPVILRGIAEAAEAGGATDVWIASHLFHREPIACAAATLAASRTIGVVLMAMSPYTVHPIHATMAAATLDELYPGRVQLCFGVGAPRDLEAAGILPEHPLQTMREALEVSRALLSGETVNVVGQRYRISGGRLAMGARPLPLWLAASGPQMLELAGGRADGVVLSAGTSPAFVRWSLEHVARGERRRGRTIKKAALVFCSVDRSEKIAKDRLRRRLAYILRGQHHARNLELAGTKLDQTALARAFAEGDWPQVEHLINDDVLHNHCVAGTPVQAASMLSAYRDSGLNEAIVYGVQERDQVASVLAVMRDADS